MMRMEEWPAPSMNSWLARTAELQRDYFGGDPAGITDPEERTDFVRRMVLGLIVEATEVLNEVKGWKWWQGQAPAPDRAKFIEEIVDVVHFAGALARVVGCTDEEWAEAYAKKTVVVRARAARAAAEREALG